MTIDVRPLARGDLSLVYEALSSRPAASHRRRLGYQEQGGYLQLVAWCDGTPAGSVGLGLPDGGDVYDLCEFRGMPVVSDLFVEEPFQRRGIGRRLMEVLEVHARSAGERGVALDTGTDGAFEPARALYRSMGYADRGGVYLGGWSDLDAPGVHFVDQLTIWIKEF